MYFTGLTAAELKPEEKLMDVKSKSKPAWKNRKERNRSRMCPI